MGLRRFCGIVVESALRWLWYPARLGWAELRLHRWCVSCGSRRTGEVGAVLSTDGAMRWIGYLARWAGLSYVCTVGALFAVRGEPVEWVQFYRTVGMDGKEGYPPVEQIGQIAVENGKHRNNGRYGNLGDCDDSVESSSRARCAGLNTQPGWAGLSYDCTLGALVAVRDEPVTWVRFCEPIARCAGLDVQPGGLG